MMVSANVKVCMLAVYFLLQEPDEPCTGKWLAWQVRLFHRVRNSRVMY
jgi:hypothetical protein